MHLYFAFKLKNQLNTDILYKNAVSVSSIMETDGHNIFNKPSMSKDLFLIYLVYEISDINLLRRYLNIK